MDVVINKCINMELTANGQKQNSSRSKKVGTKTLSKESPREPKLHQKYKQSINPSKRHRDRLNGELDNLAKLLPFPEDVIARLDKLSILRLSVSYLRNKNFFKGSLKSKAKEPKVESNSQFSFLFKEALDGFVLVITLSGEIFFVSESVKEYLGYSQSQILHQPLETLVHDDDREELTTHLQGNHLSPKIEEITDDAGTEKDANELEQQREFILRLKSVLNTSSTDMYKPFKVTGTVRRLNMEPDNDTLKYALFAFCTPARSSYSMLELRMKSTLFCSKNRIDLSFLDLDARGKEFFGYSKKDIFGRSSYVLVHRQDAQHVRCKHTEIITCGKTSLATFRLMNKNNEWNWVCGYGRVLFKNGKPDFLVTTNRIMSEEEGMAMMKLRDDADRKALARLGLMEPDDSTKAHELGFPCKNNSLHQFDSVLMDVAMPMPLVDFASLDSSGLLKREPIITKDEPNDLLKEALFDIEAPERFLNSSADQVMNDPLSNLSPEDFHSSVRSVQSPVESTISERTNISRHESSSSCSGKQSDSVNTLSFQQQHYDNAHIPLHQTPQKSIFTELTPVASSSSTISLSPLRNPRDQQQHEQRLCQQQQQQQYHHQQLPQQQNFNHVDTPSLFDDLTSLDLLQQHHMHQSDRSTPSMKLYSFGGQTPTYHTVDSYHRAQHHQQQQQRTVEEQTRNHMNFVRTHYNSHNTRMPVTESITPNVTLPYDGNSFHPQFELHNMRNESTQRHFNTFPYSFIHTDTVSQPTSWVRPAQQTYLPNTNNNNTQFMPWLPMYES